MMRYVFLFSVLSVQAMAACPEGQVERKVVDDTLQFGTSTIDTVLMAPSIRLICPKDDGTCSYIATYTPSPPPPIKTICLTPEEESDAKDWWMMYKPNNATQLESK